MVVLAHRLGKKEIVVLGFDAEILEDRVGPKSFHVVLVKTSEKETPASFSTGPYPVFYLAVSNGVV